MKRIRGSIRPYLIVYTIAACLPNIGSASLSKCGPYMGDDYSRTAVLVLEGGGKSHSKKGPKVPLPAEFVKDIIHEIDQSLLAIEEVMDQNQSAPKMGKSVPHSRVTSALNRIRGDNWYKGDAQTAKIKDQLFRLMQYTAELQMVEQALRPIGQIPHVEKLLNLIELTKAHLRVKFLDSEIPLHLNRSYSNKKDYLNQGPIHLHKTAVRLYEYIKSELAVLQKRFRFEQSLSPFQSNIKSDAQGNRQTIIELEAAFAASHALVALISRYLSSQLGTYESPVTFGDSVQAEIYHELSSSLRILSILLHRRNQLTQGSSDIRIETLESSWDLGTKVDPSNIFRKISGSSDRNKTPDELDVESQEIHRQLQLTYLLLSRYKETLQAQMANAAE